VTALSVVIAALDADSWLGEQLEALASQVTDFDWEVILADNGSRDQTKVVFERYSSRLPASSVVDASDRAGQAHARNVGAELARGGFLVFVDADDVAAPGYLAAMHAALCSDALVAAQLDRGTPSATPPPEELETYLGFLPAAAGGTLGVRRELFEELGGFDCDLPPAEDIDLCWRALLAGHELVRASGAVLWYRERSGLGAVFRQSFRYGAIQPLLYRRYRQAGMPRRHGVAALRFQLGVASVAFKVRSRADLSDWVALLAVRAGHLRGSLRYGVWYP
jgi:glycosyltransferase involved in cell wall biosynthesis